MTPPGAKHTARDSAQTQPAAVDLESYRNASSPQAAVSRRPELGSLLDRGDYPAFLREAVRSRLNILISGGTSTGKTILLNSLLHEIPQHERLIIIEDTPEL